MIFITFSLTGLKKFATLFSWTRQTPNSKNKYLRRRIHALSPDLGKQKIILELKVGIQTIKAQSNEGLITEKERDKIISKFEKEIKDLEDNL